MSNRPTAERLNDALATLMSAESEGASRVTVAALCRLAAVSRNSLYRYHPGVLDSVREFCRRRRSGRNTARGADSRSQEELVSLRDQIPKLVALVDHYYAAYCETRAVLSRRDQELAELRRRLDSKPVGLTR